MKKALKFFLLFLFIVGVVNAVLVLLTFGLIFTLFFVEPSPSELTTLLWWYTETMINNLVIGLFLLATTVGAVIFIVVRSEKEHKLKYPQRGAPTKKSRLQMANQYKV